ARALGHLLHELIAVLRLFCQQRKNCQPYLAGFKKALPAAEDKRRGPGTASRESTGSRPVVPPVVAHDPYLRYIGSYIGRNRGLERAAFAGPEPDACIAFAGFR